jgi:hypothetical protein
MRGIIFPATHCLGCAQRRCWGGVDREQRADLRSLLFGTSRRCRTTRLGYCSCGLRDLAPDDRHVGGSDLKHMPSGSHKVIEQMDLIEIAGQVEQVQFSVFPLRHRRSPEGFRSRDTVCALNIIRFAGSRNANRAQGGARLALSITTCSSRRRSKGHQSSSRSSPSAKVGSRPAAETCN